MNQIYFANYHNLQIGDRLVREKGPFSKHHGIYVGFHHGNHLVAENQIWKGVQYVTLSDFLLGHESSLTRIERFPENSYERQIVIPKINSLIGKQYDLVNFNCEHFAELIQTGKIQSRQVKNALGIAAFTLFIGVIFSSDN